MPNVEPTTTPEVNTVPMLELVGVGVGVENMGNHPARSDLWAAAQACRGRYLLDDHASAPMLSITDGDLEDRRRTSHVLEAALEHFMDSYPLPIMIAGPAAPAGALADTMQAANGRRIVGLDGRYTGTPVLHCQRGQVLQSYLNDTPDSLWDILFHTFYTYPDAPVISIAARDGLFVRASQLLSVDRSGYETLLASSQPPKIAADLSENCSMLTLACRGRIDALRATAHKVYDRMHITWNNGRQVMRTASCFDGWKPGESATPGTPYVQQPWTPFQIAQYNHLQHFGTVHCPQRAAYLDEADRLVAVAERQMRFEIALRRALAPLEGRPPTRVFYDYGSTHNLRAGNAYFRWLSSGLKALYPEFDLFDPTVGYDLAQVLGDLGAGSPFVAVALASMAGMQSGGATLIANLRRQEGVSLMLIQPPSDEQRKKDASIQRPLWPHANFD